MVTKTVRFKIPDWLYRYRWSNIKAYASWLWKPNRCTLCGKKVNYRHPEIEWRDNSMRQMMLHYDVVDYYGDCVCPECAAKCVSHENAVSKYDAERYPVLSSELETREMCDCCKEPVKSYKWVAFKMPNGKKLGFITGREWWNGFYFCPDCIRNTLLHGKEKSSRHVGYRDKDGKFKSCPQNEHGLPVIDGKVRFPY